MTEQLDRQCEVVSMTGLRFRGGRRAAQRQWSSQDVRVMRELADQGWSVEAIAARLRRTVSAVRNKAGMHGISIRMRPAEALGDLA